MANTQDRMTIGRHVASMAAGDNVIIKCNSVLRMAPHAVADIANIYGRKHGLLVTAHKVDDGIMLCASQRCAKLYLRLDTMLPGERRRIEVPEAKHPTVRARASAIAKHRGWSIKVRKIDADNIEVIRLSAMESAGLLPLDPPVSAEMRAAFEAKLMSLQQGGELALTMKRMTREQARSIASDLAAKHGITLSVDDTDAGVLVTRGPDPVRATPGRPKGSGRWNFYALTEDGSGMDVEIPPAELHKLRQAASVFSSREGIKLSVRAGARPGTARVTRIAGRPHSDDSNSPDPAGFVEREFKSPMPFEQLKMVGQWFFVSISECALPSYLRSKCLHHGKKLGIKLSVRLHSKAASLPDRGYCVIRVG